MQAVVVVVQKARHCHEQVEQVGKVRVCEVFEIFPSLQVKLNRPHNSFEPIVVHAELVTAELFWGSVLLELVVVVIGAQSVPITDESVVESEVDFGVLDLDHLGLELRLLDPLRHVDVVYVVVDGLHRHVKCAESLLP